MRRTLTSRTQVALQCVLHLGCTASRLIRNQLRDQDHESEGGEGTPIQREAPGDGPHLMDARRMGRPRTGAIGDLPSA
jgi:hypothetical protein